MTTPPDEVAEALDKIIEIADRDGIHQWHDGCKGDFMHGQRIEHKSDYYVNAAHIIKISDIAKKTRAALSRSPAPMSGDLDAIKQEVSGMINDLWAKEKEKTSLRSRYYNYRVGAEIAINHLHATGRLTTSQGDRAQPSEPIDWEVVRAQLTEEYIHFGDPYAGVLLINGVNKTIDHLKSKYVLTEKGEK